MPDKIGPWTDIYSLGVMLFFMLSGRPPFHDEAPGKLLAMHMDTPPPPLKEFAPHLHDAVCAVVDCCLAKDPHKRPSSAAMLARAFKRGLYCSTTQDGPTVAPRISQGKSTDTLDLNRPCREQGAAINVTGAREVSLEADSNDAPLQLAGSSENNAFSTTLSSSIGQVTPSEKKVAGSATNGSSRRGGAMLAAGVAMILGFVLFMTTRKDQELRAPIALKQRYFTVRVIAEGKGAHCRFGIAGGDKRIMLFPCVIRVPDGQELDLELVHGGEVLLRKVWQVNVDREIYIPAALPEPSEAEPVLTAPDSKAAAALDREDSPQQTPTPQTGNTATGRSKMKHKARLGEGLLDDF